jgi:tetratricopeptide (TPR) repeat protein
MLDGAEVKYNAILNTFSIPSLVYVNLSELYDSKGDTAKALEAAKKAYAMEKSSMLPAFIYAQRLSESGKYEEAVAVLKFPRHAVNYREDVVELWTECMKKTIEKNIADHKYTQAEENCKHLLVIVPEDAFGQEKLDEVRKLMHPDDQKKAEAAEPAAS